MHEILHVLLHAVADSLKTLPLLFAVYLLIEFIEHRPTEKITGVLSRLGPAAPVGGAILGCIPQCGISVAFANLYSGGVVSLGVLVAAFIATSDEALPLMIAHPTTIGSLWKLLLIKVLYGAFCGILIDLIYKRCKEKEHHHEYCTSEDCGCHGHAHNDNIFLSALRHSLKVFLFILIVNILLGGAIELIGEENLSSVLLSGTVFQPLLCAIVGLIPNCAASVILTELFIGKSISFGSLLAGLCAGSGLGIAVLFRTNKNKKENFCILGLLFILAVLCGIVADLIF